MDEEFQTMVEYVKHWFFLKGNMALNATWKFKKAQNFEEYVEKKNARLGSPCCSLL